jgi:hypothetical protein
MTAEGIGRRGHHGLDRILIVASTRNRGLRPNIDTRKDAQTDDYDQGVADHKILPSCDTEQRRPIEPAAAESNPAGV